MNRKLFAVLVVALLQVATAFSQTIKVQAPNLVHPDEQIRVVFTIEDSSVSDFSWDCPDGFQLVWGPQKGSSSSISIINGKKTSSKKESYTYILMAVKEGVFTLPAASATVDGRRIQSAPTKIEVIGAEQTASQGGSAANNNPSASTQQSGQTHQRSSEEIATAARQGDIILSLQLSRTTATVGEPISARLVLYKNANITGFENAKFPSFNGFWSQELSAPQNIDFHREKLNGHIYDAAVLRSYTLIPQQKGELQIDPAELVCLVSVRQPRSSGNSVFDDFFGYTYQTVRRKVMSSPVTVTVNGLPAGAPASFGGGVGKFSINARITKDSLKAHDASSLIVTVSGEGNISLVEAPKVRFPADFEVYEVKADNQSSRTSGSKVFEFPFIPRSAGEFDLDPVEYSYYDVSQGKYVTLTSGPLHVSVAKNSAAQANSGGGTMVSPVMPKDVKDLGTDIRFIDTKMPSLKAPGSFFLFSVPFFVIALLLILAAVAFWLASRSLAARKADVVGQKNRRATKLAKKKLAKANEFLSQGLSTAFYEELHKALTGFVSDKLNLNIADMSKDNIADALVGGGVDTSVAADFTGLLDACEFARYSPDGASDALKEKYEQALNTISRIDDMYRKPSSAKTTGAALMIAALMLLPLGANARQASADSLWSAGVNAYADGQWQEALDNWMSIEAQGLAAPALSCNIADACYRLGENAKAVLNYERALKLDPSYSAARSNLTFVQQFLQDKIEPVPAVFISQWCKNLCYKLSSNTWAVLSLVFLALLLVCLMLFLRGASAAARRSGFFTGIAVLLLMCIAVWFSAWQKSDYKKDNSAIVMRPVVSVKSAPGSSNTAKDLFILHEGSKVKVLETVGEWKNIELADGRQGWLDASTVEGV